MIFQTQIIWFNKIHSLKYLRSATFGSKDILIIKSEFVAKTQFLFSKKCLIGIPVSSTLNIVDLGEIKFVAVKPSLSEQ